VDELGAGFVSFEVQSPRYTTFGVFVFNRFEAATGKPRALHVEQALECIDFTGQIDKLSEQKRSHAAGFHTTVSRLVTSPYFTLEKVRMSEGVEEAVPYDEPVVWMFLEGSAELRVADLKEPVTLKKGETILLPASMNNPQIKTLSDCVWLEVTFLTKGA
jgi:mannose-6-phosphate isomerase